MFVNMTELFFQSATKPCELELCREPSACSAECDQESGFHRIQHQFRNFESEILRTFRPIRRIFDPCNGVKFILNEPYQNFHVSICICPFSQSFLLMLKSTTNKLLLRLSQGKAQFLIDKCMYLQLTNERSRYSSVHSLTK